MRIFSGRKSLVFAMTIVAIFGGYALERVTTPRVAKAIPFPFQDGECLKYSQIYINMPDSASSEYDVCFDKTESGFTEKGGERTSTYNTDGFLRLTEDDKASWKKVLGKNKENTSRIESILLENALSDLDSHNVFYGPPDLSVGDLFYDKYPVSELADYNSESAYVVERNPWTDTRISDKGVVLKNFWKSMFRFNRLVFKPTIRTGQSNDLIERFYYSRSSGVLLGSERMWVTRDKSGKIISGNSALSGKNMQTKLTSLNRLKNTMKIESPAFGHNQPIPAKYTCQGDDVNPPLEISGTPQEAKSLALIVDDPDASMGIWVHWTVWNITPHTKEISGNSAPNRAPWNPNSPATPLPADQGMTDFGRPGYGGPCPPSGTHRYFFKLYALDTLLDLPQSSTKSDLEKAMRGHILAQAELIGLYKKQ